MATFSEVLMEVAKQLPLRKVIARGEVVEDEHVTLGLERKF